MYLRSELISVPLFAEIPAFDKRSCAHFGVKLLTLC